MDSRDAPDASEAGVGVRVLLPDGGQMEPPEEEGEGDDAEDEAGDDATEAVEEVDDQGEGVSDEDAESENGTAESGDDDEAGSEAEEGDEAEANESEGAEADEEEAAEETAEGDEEGEETEREKAVSDEGSRILHLNLDGLFLDLLGLEVDLDTVTLDITAVPGESKLLGNLLSAVSGLLSGDPLSNLLPDNPLSGLFGGGEGDEEGEGEGEGSGLLPEVHPIQRAKALAGSMADAIRGAFKDAGASIIAALPLEELLAQFLQEIVNQLLETTDDDGGESEAEEAAPSA